MRILVIVESPSKVEKIKKILNSQDDGHSYVVAASCGHIMKLSTDQTHEKSLGVDTKNNYQPDFIADPNKKNVILTLKKQKNACDQVWIASDLDYEGEFIGWSLCKCLGLSTLHTPRLIFNEITKDAIVQAAQQPTVLNQSAIDARICRRVMDRLIGFKISSAARSINNKLRVGRVQTMMVKMVIDREKEMNSHQKTFSFHTEGLFVNHGTKIKSPKALIQTRLNTQFKGEEHMEEFLEVCRVGLEPLAEQPEPPVFLLTDKSERTLTQNPPAPLITSTLQSLVSRRLGVTPKKVLDIAQSLYQKGVTSYPRTDCPRLPGEKMDSFGAYILKKYGSDYHQSRDYNTTGGQSTKKKKDKKEDSAQEAHACIYPTEVSVEELNDNSDVSWTGYEKNVYRLIWLYAVSSQMSASQTRNTRGRIELRLAPDVKSENPRPKDYFTTDHNLLTFEGYLKLWGKTAADLGDEDDSSEDGQGDGTSGKNNALLKLKIGDLMNPLRIAGKQKARLGPAPYTEASLIKKLSQHGIGRPSTYGQIMETVMTEGFIYKGNKVGEKMGVKLLSWGTGQTVADLDTEVIVKEELVKMNAYRQRLFSTELGRAIDQFVSDYFPEIFNYTFTRDLESDMDLIEKGQVIWYQVVDGLYQTFEPKLKQFRVAQRREDVDMTNKRSLGDYQGKDVWVYLGRYGPVVQHGEGEDKRFVELDKELSIEAVNIEDIKALLGIPRMLGKMADGRLIWLKRSRFGLYITTEGENGQERVGKNGKVTKLNKLESELFTSYDAEKPAWQQVDQLDTGLVRQALELVDQPKAVLKKLKDLEIIDGRYGPYFQMNTVNVNIPKKVDFDALTYEQCLQFYELKLKRNPTARKKALRPDGQPKPMLGKISLKKGEASNKKLTITPKKTIGLRKLSVSVKTPN